MPSSMVPLQSLSTPSHTSADGPTEPVHPFTPDEQVIVPALHWPTQFATSPPGQRVAHAAPTSVGLLSTAPSQSSSMPLHTSALGPIDPAHSGLPFTQLEVPARHWPTQFATRPPGQLPPHGTPTSVGLSSAVPSQSSSSPLHSSGVGPTTWE